MAKTVKYFDSISGDYKTWVNQFDLNSRLDWFASQLCRSDIEEKVVLDIGCGPGYFSGLVMERGGRPIAG